MRALERFHGTGQDTTVVIRHFRAADEWPAHSLADGDAVVERNSGEMAPAFRERAIETLRRGRRGIVVLVEKGEA